MDEYASLKARDPVHDEDELHAALQRDDREAAAKISGYLADLRPGDAHAQRVASGHLTAFGSIASAEPYARRAVELAPENPEYALHFGVVLNLAGKFEQAAKVLLRLAKTAPVHPETYMQLANASEKLGFPDVAAQFALQSARQEPGNEDRRLAVAHFLARLGDVDQAILTLMDEGAQSHTLSAPALATLSSLLGQAGRFDEALQQIELALEKAPDRADFLLHHSWVLMQLGLLKEALVSARRAVELDPDNRNVRRHAVTVFVENGEVEEALRHGGALLAQSPGEDEYVSCMAYLIEARAAREATEVFSDIAALKRAAPRRELPPPPTFKDRLATQRRSIAALVLRDIRARNGESKLGFFWTLMEPFIHVGALAIVFQFTMHGKPPLGDNFFFFYFTGVMPYLMVSHLILHLGHGVRGNRHLLQISKVTPFDIMISTTIVEVFTTLIVYVLFSAIFALFGIDAIPTDIPVLAGAFAISALLGMGCGMMCAALFEFGPFGESVVSILVRMLYFASGIFYVPGNMPLFVRDILSYNPLLHCIDGMRMGYFSTYRPPWSDIGYAAAFSVITLALGMLAIAAVSRRMRSIH